jgi:O-antigen/teichoic acid export membrane protein
VVFSLALSVVLVFFMNNKFEGRILGVTIPAILVDFIIYINILIKGRKVIPSYAKYAISMAVPLIPSALSSTILSTSDRIMITNFCGTEQTALYSVAYSVSSIAGILWSALNQAWGPWFYDRLNEKKYSEIEIFSNRFAMIYAGLVIGIMLISPEIVYIMGGKSYYDTIDVMPPVVLAMVFQFFYAFYFNAEYFYGETYIISIGTAIAAVVNIGLNFLLIPHFGYKAAAYTTMIGYMVMLIYHYLIVKYKLGKSFIYNNRFFVMLIVGMIILQVFIAILYHMIFIRYSIIILYFAIIGAIIWKNKNTLIILLNRIVKKNK